MDILGLKRSLLPYYGLLTTGDGVGGASGATGAHDHDSGSDVGGSRGGDRDHGGGGDHTSTSTPSSTPSSDSSTDTPSLGSGLTVNSPSFSADYSLAPTNTPGIGLNPDTSRVTAGIGLNTTGTGYSDNTGTVNAPNPYSLSKDVTYGDLANMQAAGYGDREGLNVNNPTQTVDQLLASKSVGDFLGATLPNVALGMATGMMSPALATALRIGIAAQNHSLGETAGGMIGALTGSPAIGSIGAMLGRSIDTGRPVTAKDIAAVGFKSVSQEIGKHIAKAGYSVAGPIGAKVAGVAANKASSRVGQYMGAYDQRSNGKATGKTNSTTGGKR